MKISIVIPTLPERKEMLEELKASIPKNWGIIKEIIVIDDIGLSLSEKRNKGAKESSGDYILFIDDDNVLKDGSIEKVLDLVDDFPYNAQFFCHKLWDNFYDTKMIKLGDIEPTLNLIITENTPVFLSIWDDLSLFQRRLLEAIVHAGSKDILIEESIEKYDLESISTAETALKSLMEKQILDKENDVYWFTDVFFKEWIRRKI